MKKIFFSLMALICTMGASAQVEPVAGETYYIQNVDGQFLSRGNAWGTQASLDAYGMPWTLVGTDLTSVQLQILGQTSVLGFDEALYTDAGGSNARSYVIDGNTTDGYTITSTTGYACYISGTTVSGSTTETAAKWKFLTKAQRDEYVNNAIATAKTNAYTTAGFTESQTLRTVDVTSSVTNYGLDSNTDGWTVTISRSQTGQPASSNSCSELWQATGSLTQTVSGLLANGLYKLEIRAQYRCGGSSNDAAYEMYNTNGYNHVNATVGLNGNNIPVCHWASYSGKPNTRPTFESAIKSGADVYLNTVYGNADADGNLTITINKPGYAGSIDWFTFGQIKLYQMTDQVSDDDIAALEATIPTGAMDATVKSTMDEAKATLDAEKTIVNYNALSDAIDAANASVAAYAAAKATADAANTKAATAGVDVATAYNAFTEAYTAGTLNGTTEAEAVATAYTEGVATKLAGCTNITSYITNPSFETNNMNGWTNDGCGNAATNKNWGSRTGDIFAEKWIAGGNTLANGTLTQAIASLPKGEYILTVDGKNEQQSNGTAQTGFYATIGDKEYEFNSASYDQAVISYTAEETGDITIGVKLDNCQGNWICYDNFQLYYNGIFTKVLIDEIATATAQYNTYDPAADYAVALKAAIDDAQGKLDAGFEEASALDEAVAELQAAETAAALAERLSRYADLADGKYIISTEAGTFFGAGNSWGTQASLLAHPEYVTLAKMEDGKYTIESQVNNGGDSKYFNGSYMDGAATEIEILTTAGGYLLSDGTQYYGGTTTVAAQADEFVWTITSLTDMDAQMASATEAAPMDVTYKVLDPNFGRNNVNWSSWTNTEVSTNGDNANKVAESWHKGAFYLGQTISNLPAGTYQIKCNAVYTQATETLPYVFANGATYPFNMTSDTYSTAAEYATSFADGNYAVDFKVYVTDGEIRLGAKTTDTANNWYVFDNFQLYYLGEAQAEGAEASEFAGNVKIKAVEGADENYGTFCAPVDVTMPAGVTAYEVELAEDQVTLELTAINGTVEANTPVIVGSETAQCFDNFYTGKAEKAEVCGDGILKGVFAPTVVASGEHAVYVMQNQSGKVGFYVVSSTDPKTVPANRCYLQIEEQDAPEARDFIGFGNSTKTAINAINALTSGKAEIYDMSGRRLSGLQKGMNIVNGQKVLVK